MSYDSTAAITITNLGAKDNIIIRENLVDNFDSMQSPIQTSVVNNDVFVHATERASLDVISKLGLPVMLANVLYWPEDPFNKKNGRSRFGY